MEQTWSDRRLATGIADNPSFCFDRGGGGYACTATWAATADKQCPVNVQRAQGRGISKTTPWHQ